jgi:DNA-binding transcriptional LysR family regulator
MLMAMELDHVEAFVAVVRLGSLTRATAVLHLSQPAISRRLHLLEGELGVQLFDRLRTGVRINDAGKAFLPHAEAVLASMHDGVDAVNALRGVQTGVVTLVLVGTLASTPLTNRLRRFGEAYPTVDLRLRTALSAEVSALVVSGEASLGLRYGADPDPHLVSTIVYQERLIPVCGTHHRLATATRVFARALAGERWLAFPPRSTPAREPYTASLAERLAANGLSASEIVHIDSLTAQKRMIEAGFGIGLLPESSVTEELRAGTLQALKIAGLRATIPVALLHRRRAFQSRATKTLVSLLSNWANPV